MHLSAWTRCVGYICVSKIRALDARLCPAAFAAALKKHAPSQSNLQRESFLATSQVWCIYLAVVKLAANGSREYHHVEAYQLSPTLLPHDFFKRFDVYSHSCSRRFGNIFQWLCHGLRLVSTPAMTCVGFHWRQTLQSACNAFPGMCLIRGHDICSLLGTASNSNTLPV